MNERKLTKSELDKREDIIKDMKRNKRALVKRYGKDAEKVMYGRATNLAKKQAEAMDQDKIKELVKDALQNPKKADLNKDGKLSDYEEKRGAAIEKNLDEMDLNDPVAMKMRAAKDKLSKMRAANAGDDGNDKFFDDAKLRALKKKRAEIMLDMEQEAEMEGGPIADKYGDMLNVIDAEIAKQNAMMGLEEDLDLGHEDNEPHMLKADLYRIGKYAMELYQMVDQFEQGSEEVDFPHWWQSKIIKSKDMLVSAKHYLDFEIKEPQIDAMVDVAAEEEVIDENALGMTDSRLSSDQHRDLDYAVRGDSAYTFGNDPYADDQLRYKYAVKMGFLEETIEEGLPKGFWKKETAELDESFEKLVSKLEKQGKSKKAATAIAGAVAAYKAKGGGKGPTAKQKARG